MHLQVPHLGDALAALDEELATWSAHGRRGALWWRDDDARAPTPEFARLMGVSDRYGVPLLAAVVPTETAPDLGPHLASRVWVAQHGVDHTNHHLVGRPNQFPPHTPSEVILSRLLFVREHLSELPRRLPIYVPPWNTIVKALPEAISAAGFTVLSAFGRALQQAGPVLRADTHVDLLRWAPHARFHGVSYCLHRLTHHLRRRRLRGHFNQPIGLLTHHLVHDEAMWRFLEEFLAHTSVRPGIEWLSPEVFPRYERIRIDGLSAQASSSPPAKTAGL